VITKFRSQKLESSSRKLEGCRTNHNDDASPNRGLPIFAHCLVLACEAPDF
jgi:hypothetical protein